MKHEVGEKDEEEYKQAGLSSDRSLPRGLRTQGRFSRGGILRRGHVSSSIVQGLHVGRFWVICGAVLFMLGSRLELSDYVVVTCYASVVWQVDSRVMKNNDGPNPEDRFQMRVPIGTGIDIRTSVELEKAQESQEAQKKNPDDATIATDRARSPVKASGSSHNRRSKSTHCLAALVGGKIRNPPLSFSSLHTVFWIEGVSEVPSLRFV